MTRSISIILPVYNAEKYLRQCVDSVAQLKNLLDWELLLVDDGSTDSSPSICDNYSSNNDRIRVFHIENNGVSNARNFGMAAASKDYVTFIDADDWIDSVAFVQAFDTFLKLDVELGFTPFFRVVSGKCQNVLLEYGETRALTLLEKDELLKKRLAAGDRFMGGVWKNFYSMNLLKGLAFDSELKYQEDVFFLVQTLYKANRVAIVNQPFYYYRINLDSVNFNQQINSIDNRRLVLEKMLKWASQNHLDLSFAKMRRHCPIYARMFVRAAAESRRGFSRVKSLWKIHSEIPSEEFKQWKCRFWGKSFAPYSVLCRYGFNFLGFLFLCIRFF